MWDAYMLLTAPRISVLYKQLFMVQISTDFVNSSITIRWLRIVPLYTIDMTIQIYVCNWHAYPNVCAINALDNNTQKHNTNTIVFLNEFAVPYWCILSPNQSFGDSFDTSTSIFQGCFTGTEVTLLHTVYGESHGSSRIALTKGCTNHLKNSMLDDPCVMCISAIGLRIYDPWTSRVTRID